MDIMFEGQKGYKKYDATLSGNQGFDGLYIKTKPDNCNVLEPNNTCQILDIIIGEAKQMKTNPDGTNDGQIFLNAMKERPGNENGPLPPQMTDEWVRHVLSRMPGRKLREAIEDFIDKNGNNKIVIATNTTDGIVRIVKIAEDGT